MADILPLRSFNEVRFLSEGVLMEFGALDWVNLVRSSGVDGARKAASKTSPAINPAGNVSGVDLNNSCP